MSPSDTLILAVPSKGRLMDATLERFSQAGLQIERVGNPRGYGAQITNVPDVEVQMLSAAEISTSLRAGTVHLGVTGEDLLRENIADADDRIDFVVKLGFGQADVVVAVPEAWLDVRTMIDLDEVAMAFHAQRGRRMRVATKYINLTRRFFASHGLSAYRIVESLGATEGTPAAGTAEVIVDITSTGSTLRANHLKVLEDGVILRSQANLAGSRGTSLGPKGTEARRRILTAFDV